MSSLTVTRTPVEPYTWAAAGFAWTAPEAARAWQNARVVSVTAEAAEDLGAAAGGGRSAERCTASALALSEERRTAAAAELHAALGFSETCIDLIRFISGPTRTWP